MKRISVLGSTGSIGTNCLNVIAAQQNKFEIKYLTTFQNVELLFEQAKKLNPKAVAVQKKEAAVEYIPKFKELGIEVFVGFKGVLEISQRTDVDIVVNALVGAIGLQPTLNAIRKNCRIALANKESLVIGGQFVMEKARELGAEIIPIDSEHSALLQCIAGEEQTKIRCVILTASGGPFREIPFNNFPNLTVEQALNHPNWTMGQKITVDSATLMNKGLEVIEAHWLFNLAPSKIQVVIHPQSIIHGMVEFEDGSVKAQMGVPDMRIPIQYALTYPKRMASNFPRLNFCRLKELTFEPPDLDKFRCLKLAYEALEYGGSAPAILNAANEEAVKLFLNRRIRFDQIPQIVEETLTKCDKNSFHRVDEILKYDYLAREFVKQRYS
ncbi:MAG: 1-deoxy-D-xylulose-5-phosphate reductoisomerase [bacterium]